METLDISAKDFIAGESQSDAIADAGFSPLSYGLNLTRRLGVLHFLGTSTDRGGATLTDDIVAICRDPAISGNDIYAVDDAANIYTLSGATFTKRQTGAQTYQLGTTDLVTFQSNFYVTSQLTVGQFDNNATNFTENWWTGLTSGYRHPLEVVEDELFIADKNVIYYWNGTSSGVAFTLPQDQNVTSMRRHTDGRTLLAFTGGTADFSHTRPNSGRVYYCNPTIRDWEREIELSAQVEGTRVVGGVIFCTWGKRFGYFDGNGLIFLKKLETSETTYSHSMSNMEDILLVRDGTYVLAYGDIEAGRKWWRVASFPTLLGITCVFGKGDNKFLTAYTSSAGSVETLTELDLDDVGSGGQFYSRVINFPRQVKIRKIVLFHDPTNDSGTTWFTVTYRDTLQVSESDLKEFLITNLSVVRSSIECDLTTDMFQVKLTLNNDDIGFRLIRIYYEPIE